MLRFSQTAVDLIVAARVFAQLGDKLLDSVNFSEHGAQEGTIGLSVESSKAELSGRPAAKSLAILELYLAEDTQAHVWRE